jgi:hypothetical protein
MVAAMEWVLIITGINTLLVVSYYQIDLYFLLVMEIAMKVNGEMMKE